MKIKNTLPTFMAIIYITISLVSCQDDISTLGSDTIGGQDIDVTLNASSTVISYSKELGPVQTNQLPAYQLGTYNDPVYGKSKFELVSQLNLRTPDPDFGFEAVLDSVILYIPYFATGTELDEVITYELDSVFGVDPINIKVYESNYYLRDYDPATGLQERQKYYSSLGNVFEMPSNVGPLIYEITDFFPNKDSYLVQSPDGDDEDTDPDENLEPPGLRVRLPVAFFEEKIMNQEGTTELMNNNNFKEYFRGLYFQVDDLGTDGNLFLFDINNAIVYMKYTYEETEPEEGVDGERLSGVFALNFVETNVNVNIIDNQLTPSIEAELDTVDTVNGESSLYVRGGEGIVTIIDLFGEDLDGNEIADELDVMRQEEWLINDANLIFYVDQDKMVGGASEPERLLIYDSKNALVLADYGLDPTITDLPGVALSGHLGILDRGTDENGDFYKIRLTHHISSLVHKDSTNNPLALIVTQNVLAGGFRDLEDPEAVGIDKIPSGSVLGHEGTILHGNTSAIEEKRLKLQIYYTKPN
tara:strand:+ start:12461 stop:14047 length:1587 start_codon:yes stop_codon:yes gene_type:complete